MPCAYLSNLPHFVPAIVRLFVSLLDCELLEGRAADLPLWPWLAVPWSSVNRRGVREGN